MPLPKPEILSDEKINGKTQTVNLLDYANKQPGQATPEYETVTSSAQNSSAYDAYAALLRDMQAQREAQINAAYNQSKASLDSAKNKSMKNAYISYMQGMKNAPQAAALGGNGGYAQSLITKQQLGYENNRSAIEQNYMDNLRELEAQRQAGLIESNQDYLSGMMGLVKDVGPKTVKTTTNQWTGRYKVGDKTMTPQEYMEYLAEFGYNADTAADYMQKNNLPYYK